MKTLKWRDLTIVFDYILALCLVLDCRSLYGRMTITPGWFGYLTTIGLLAGLFGKAFMRSEIVFRKQQVDAWRAYILFFLAFLMFCTAHLFNGSSVKFLLKLTLIFIYYMLDKKEDGVSGLLLKYKNIIVLIAAVSLFFWLFGSMLSILKPSGYVYSDWTGNTGVKRCPSYYFLYFETQDSSVSGILPSSLIRNSAVFTEAPMASFHFVLALIIEYYLNAKRDIRKVVLLCVAAVSTMSTTGFCMLILMFLFRLKDINRKYFLFLLPFLIVAVLVSGIVAIRLVTAKLGSGSGMVRLDDFRVCFKAWLMHPLFGCGIDNSEYIRSFMGAWRKYNNGLSNSPGQILAQGGLFLFSVYLACIVCGIRNSKKYKQLNQMTFCFLFALMFCITVVPYNLITMFVFLWMIEGTARKSGYSSQQFIHLLFSLRTRREAK